MPFIASLAFESDTWRQPSTDTGNESRIKARFKINGKKLIYTADINIYNDAKNEDQIIGSKQFWYAKDFTGNARRIHYPLEVAPFLRRGLHRRDGHVRDSELYYLSRRFNIDGKIAPVEFQKSFIQISNFLKGITYFSASQFTNPSLCPVSIEVDKEGETGRGIQRRLYSEPQGVHEKFLYDIFKAQNTESYSEFYKIVGPKGIGLVDSIEFKEIPTSSIEYSVKSGGKVVQRKQEKILVVPQFVIGRNKLSPSQLSEGTFKTITLLFYLMTQRSSALLIEEPEVCVHHGLLTSIVELIKEYSHDKQIIMSTHSDFVLDQIETRSVYKVTRSSSVGTNISPIEKNMSAKELMALKNYLETEGNLGEYWRHGGFE